MDMRQLLHLKEGYKLQVFKNEMLRKICGPEINGMRRECRMLHNEELHHLYPFSNIVRVVTTRKLH
jgi:hypothetical protein